MSTTTAYGVDLEVALGIGLDVDAGRWGEGEAPPIPPGPVYGPPQSPYTTQTPGGSFTDTNFLFGADVVCAVAGRITGLRYYRHASGTETSRTMRLWHANGTELAAATLSGLTGSGWKVGTLSTPIIVTAGQTVRVSLEISGASSTLVYSNQSNDVTNGDVSIPAGAHYAHSGLSTGRPTQISPAWRFLDLVFEKELPAAVVRAESPDAGRFDVDRWGDPDTLLGDWVDVTCDTLDQVGLRGGAFGSEGVVNRWEAVTASVTLLGSQWDPWHGPYAGLVGPQLPVRIRWRPTGSPTWLTAFLGAVDAVGYQWIPEPDPNDSVAILTCVDGTADLVAYDGLEQSPVGEGETAAQRVTRILDTAQWPADRRDITAGGVTLKGTTLAGVAWTELLQVADTDLALLWVNRAGKLAYRPKGRIGLGVDLGETIDICGEDGSIQAVTMIRAQPDALRNQVSISRQVNEGEPDAATVTLRDETSIARYRAKTYRRTDLLHLDDAWSTTVAQTIISGQAWPSSAPRRVVLDAALGDPRVPPLLLSVEPENVLTIRWDNTDWLCAVAGWDVDLTHDSIGGILYLDDMSTWLGSRWDTSVWDRDRWGAVSWQ